eukprot:TRINITY_DN31134_c0_g1_i1.p1 TRINITY_DN31134_c0_g1~~TRINITY_DN31134_c0_g1_i1.p1  ORF type:complete len:661 (-),score=69.49 TRINITY_DN31134_c0_g1_i1:127-2109(-)
MIQSFFASNPKKKEYLRGTPQDIADLLNNFTHVNYDTNGDSYLVPFGLQNLHQRTLDLTNQHTQVGRRGISDLTRGLVQNYVVNFVELRGCALGTIGAKCIGHLLQHNNTITYLGLASNNIDAEAAAFLGTGLSANTLLRKLDLSHNDLRSTGAGHIANALTHNHFLRILILAHNKITPQFATDFCVSLAANSGLIELDVSFNKISDGGVLGIAQALRLNKTLRRLYLTKNAISQAGGSGLFDALQIGCKLIGLNLANNRVSGAVLGLINVLPNAQHFRQLNLSCDFISPQDAVTLAEAIRRNQTLTDLNLSLNDLKDHGAIPILKALQGKKTLFKLCLTKCEIDFTGEEASDELCNILKTCANLTILQIAGNVLGCESGNKLARTLQACDENVLHLTHLDVAETKIGAIGGAVLLSTVSDIQTFVELNLAGNNIGDDGFLQLASAVKDEGGLGSLKSLDFSDNDLNIAVEMTLCEFLLSSTHLKQIVLRGNKVCEGLPNGIMQQHHALKLLETYQYCNDHLWAGNTQNTVAKSSCVVDLPTIREKFAEEEEEKRKEVENEVTTAKERPPDPRIPTLTNNVGGLLVTEAQLRKKFDTLDFAGRGVLERETFKQMFQKLEGYGVEWNDESIERLMSKNNIRVGENITFDEFCIMMLQVVCW